ncbi:hypothetical protein ACWF94_39655 [Streptomyces sp. NPDC055078]
MDITRRNILRGMAVAPVAAAAGGLLFSGTAEAASRIRLRRVNGGIGGDFERGIRGLRAAGLPPARVRTVLADLDRTGRNVGASLPDAPGGLAKAFTWDKRDFGDFKWRPQGITGLHDARGTGGSVLVVSWYGRAQAGNAHQGAKVTFIDVSSGTPRYRHVLLVEPVFGTSGHHGFEPVDVHAGGIAWYKDRLYVADSAKGALRVFHTNEMFRATGFDPDYCGRDSAGKYHAYNNAYVLPQGRMYQLVGVPEQLRFSQVSLDRTTRRHSLVVSEFRRGVSGTNIAHWDLNERSRYGYPARLTSAPTVRIAGGTRIQGAVRVGGSYRLSVSDGGSPGHLKRTTRPSGGVARVTRLGRLPVGPEDMSYDVDAKRIWSLNEYEGNRYFYSFRPGGSQ